MTVNKYSTIAKSFTEKGNLTRGQFGQVPNMKPVTWDPESNDWTEDRSAKSADQHPQDFTWGCWDSDWGWMAPWPVEDHPNFK